jgi:hydrogenase maturation protease
MDRSCRNCAGASGVGPGSESAADALLVIGYGNTLRRDDGVGVYLAEALTARGWPGVEVIACHQLTPELAEPISRAAAVVFADAGFARRQVRMERVRPLTGGTVLAHECSPGVLLGLAQALFGRQPPGWVLTLPAEDFGLGEGLSPLARTGLQTGLRRLEAWVGRWRKGRRRGGASDRAPGSVASEGTAGD